MIARNIVDEITNEITANFRTFGGGQIVDPSNPIAHWTKDQAPTFAMGVDVRDVVKAVLKLLATCDRPLTERATAAAAELTECWTQDVVESEEMAEIILHHFARGNTCARRVCFNDAEWLHPDGSHRRYCTICKDLIEEQNPTLRDRFVRPPVSGEIALRRMRALHALCDDVDDGEYKNCNARELGDVVRAILRGQEVPK